MSWLMAELCSPLGEPQYGWGSMLLHFPATTVLTLAAKYVTKFYWLHICRVGGGDMSTIFNNICNNNIQVNEIIVM